MKITVYTITDCQFSKTEKEYLTSNKLQFEEKNLETNKEFVTEMMAISNNFAGTPVTRVEKDDGSIAVLKGFTKEEFDTTFGFAPPPSTPAATITEPPKTETTPPGVETPPQEPVATPNADSAPIVEPPKQEETPVVETPPTIEDSKLDNVLDKLEKEVKDEPVETPKSDPVVPPVIETPTPEATTPTIPDFPAGDTTKTT